MVVAGVEELLGFAANRLLVPVVVVAPVEFGVEFVFPNKLVGCAGFAAPPKMLEVGVCEPLLNSPPPGAAAALEPDELLPAAPPNNGFCSPGLDAVFPNRLEVPDEVVVAG